MAKNYWPVVESYFHNRNFAQMEIASFNQFIDLKLNEIVDENKTIAPKIEEVKIELSKIECGRPKITEADGSPRTIYPMEARLRNRTYSAPLHLTMRLLRRDVEQDVKRTYIGELPIMLKSNRCWLEGKSDEELIEFGEDPKDFGGYFIINGSEKVLMTQEVLSSDRVLVSEGAQERISAEVISTRGAFKGRVRITRTPDGLLNVTFPASPRKLRLFVLLKALGMKTDQEIEDAFGKEAEIQNDVLINSENTPVKDEEDALDRIGKFVAPGQVIDYRLRRAGEVIDAFLLPHIGQKSEHRLAKAYYLIMMATRSIERAHKLRGEDDKDHYANKRLELSGKLMEHLFRYSFKYFIKDLKFQVDRTITRRRKLNISTVVRPGAVTERIRFAMSTGNWIGRATGVSKFMDRVNYLAPLTDLRKVKSPLDKNRELYEARDVHGTHFGRLCPIETPDGPQCVTPDTEIVLEDGSAMTMEQFGYYWQKERVKSVDWESEQKEEKKANAIRFLRMAPKQKVVKLKTQETGRTIHATLDHPFYSESLGKTELKNLKAGDRIAVLPIKPLPFEPASEKKILGEEETRLACPEKSDAEYIVRELKQRGLLPLKDDDKRLLALARLVGHCFGDGSLTVSMKKYKSSCATVFCGKEVDLQEIAQDVRELGFTTSKITTWNKHSVLEDGRTINGVTTRMECYAKPLWVLLRALGAPAGDKALQPFGVPAWVKQGRKVVVRAFLAAYFGSEMTTPKTDKRNGKTFLQPAFSLNKSKEMVENGVHFAEEIKELMQPFNVQTTQIKVTDGVRRKSGTETRKIKILLNADLENLIALYGTIGFEYCQERKVKARFTLSYLEHRLFEIRKRQAIAKRVIALAQNGARQKAILESIDYEVRSHDVANWVKAAKKGNHVAPNVSDIDFPTFSQWVREHAIVDNGMVWETIEQLNEAEAKEVVDITTMQGYHNFIANNFLVGNCGLVKNLALLCEVTTETSEDPVEKLLREMGVKLK